MAAVPLASAMFFLWSAAATSCLALPAPHPVAAAPMDCGIPPGVDPEDVRYQGQDGVVGLQMANNEPTGVYVICPLASMAISAETVQMDAQQLVFINGTEARPRLWTRVIVTDGARMTIWAVSMRDQTTPDALGRYGSAMQIFGHVAVYDSTFQSIWGDLGGAVSVDGGGSASFFGCLFERNVAVRDGANLFSSGGAVGNYGGLSSFDRCTFRENLAEYDGGALLSSGARAVP